MKYTAIKAVHGINEEYLVMGQRNTDLNWDILNRVGSKAEAEEMAEKVCLSLSRAYKSYIPFYRCSGYGSAYLNGELYKK